MAEEKSSNVFQKVVALVRDLVDWVEDTFTDPELAKQLREDLGLNGDNPATPPVVDATLRQKIDVELAKKGDDFDEAALVATLAQLGTLVDTLRTFAEAVKADGVSATDVVWLLFKVWSVDSLKVRNPSAYALCQLAGLVLEDDEVLDQLDPAPVLQLLRGEADGAYADAVVDRLATATGAIVVLLDRLVSAVGGRIDALYGWDPEPGTAPEAALAAARALTVRFHTGSPLTPALTLVPITREAGGPGLLVSIGGTLELEHDAGAATVTTLIGAHGAFAVTFRFSTDDPDLRVHGGGTPQLEVRLEPKTADGAPALVVGANGGTRLEVGGFGLGVQLTADAVGLLARARKGRLVISLGDGDGFLATLGADVEVPFDLGLVLDTAHGVRFDGGTGLKVELPVSAALLGVLTVQYLALELRLTGTPELEARGGFSVKLGPFQASVDQVGAVVDLAALVRGGDAAGDLVRFAPPRGIGLALDLGVVKGGGYLFVDAERGEYAGALELKFVTWGIKAIALLTTKRPDGSEGWSLLLFVFGTFRLHIAFGIFLNGLGGMIGLHHRADLDALTAGMRTGALDDVLFPENPVADAPRIIARYRTLFPIEPDSLLLGPMLELSFSQPPIVYVRLGLVFEVRNALGGDKPTQLTKVILLGQLLVQLPPRELGLPAIVKLLVDVVGFYDAVEQFLLVRARLRDSFVGIEKVAKLDLSGELLLAMRFGDEPSFVLSAGGFHPSFDDVPRGVPAVLERLAVSFGIGVIKLRSEQYVAITSNTVQAGLKLELKATIEVASISGHLSLDALLYLQPEPHFRVDLEFRVKVEAFGSTLASVTVHMSLTGPGEWRAVGHFSFSILWWDVEIPFDESWGSGPGEVLPPATSAAALLHRELSDPDRLLPGPPVGGNALVTLAQAEPGASYAHPLGVVTIAQKAVPLGVEIDRVGTRSLTEGRARFAVEQVRVGGLPVTGTEEVHDHFARGQFMELSEEQKLAGRSFETFTSGVRVGTTAYRVDDPGTRVDADYEVEVLEPEPFLHLFWRVGERYAETLTSATADRLVRFGAAALSTRAREAELRPSVGRAAVVEPGLAVVDPVTLQPSATVTGLATSEAVAQQLATAAGGLVVEAFELAVAP